eukprot:NODE_1097_length_2607_cov_5.876210.p1 GENE.NODE_1097_length_2607_cov_5.876210~~NODE_1097_length_2607_cov_5.876210.p1  ORF type:complete len:810 (+),score=114.50 NODE_1097_length_2607_cov_5.876210:96-2525(+)
MASAAGVAALQRRNCGVEGRVVYGQRAHLCPDEPAPVAALVPEGSPHMSARCSLECSPRSSWSSLPSPPDSACIDVSPRTRRGGDGSAWVPLAMDLHLEIPGARGHACRRPRAPSNEDVRRNIHGPLKESRALRLEPAEGWVELSTATSPASVAGSTSADSAQWGQNSESPEPPGSTKLRLSPMDFAPCHGVCFIEEQEEPVPASHDAATPRVYGEIANKVQQFQQVLRTQNEQKLPNIGAERNPQSVVVEMMPTEPAVIEVPVVVEKKVCSASLPILGHSLSTPIPRMPTAPTVQDVPVMVVRPTYSRGCAAMGGVAAPLVLPPDSSSMDVLVEVVPKPPPQRLPQARAKASGTMTPCYLEETGSACASTAQGSPRAGNPSDERHKTLPLCSKASASVARQVSTVSTMCSVAGSEQTTSRIDSARSSISGSGMSCCTAGLLSSHSAGRNSSGGPGKKPSLPRTRDTYVYLHEQGQAALQQGRVDEAHTFFSKANDVHMKLCGAPSGEALYNLARCYSLECARPSDNERLNLALAMLAQSFEAGYEVGLRSIADDTKLQELRDRRPGQFAEVVKRAHAAASIAVPPPPPGGHRSLSIPRCFARGASPSPRSPQRRRSLSPLVSLPMGPQRTPSVHRMPSVRRSSRGFSCTVQAPRVVPRRSPSPARSRATAAAAASCAVAGAVTAAMPAAAVDIVAMPAASAVAGAVTVAVAPGVVAPARMLEMMPVRLPPRPRTASPPMRAATARAPSLSRPLSAAVHMPAPAPPRPEASASGCMPLSQAKLPPSRRRQRPAPARSASPALGRIAPSR